MSTSRNGSFLVVFIIVVYQIVCTSPGGVGAPGTFKNSLFNWSATPNQCAANSVRLLNLVNLVCSTAQATNITNRDACYGCFARFVSLPQGQQQLTALSLCAALYFTGTSYESCATRLNLIASSSAAVYSLTLNQCTAGYCEFVQCLRRTNLNNLIIQCSREVRALAAVNLAVDADVIRLYTNMTSCILAKARCGLFNPVTGDPQIPGFTTTTAGKGRVRVPVYNSLQVTPDGTLRIIAFPGTAIPAIFCSSQNTLAQSNWILNECP